MRLTLLQTMLESALAAGIPLNNGPPSVMIILLMATFPLFVTKYVYWMTSPASVIVVFAPPLTEGALADLTNVNISIGNTGISKVSG